MSRLMSRGAVLTASRISSYGILFFSPLFLVRILDVVAYGQYQEFMIYATFFVTACEFGIHSSLTYFVPKHPERERTISSQTSVLILLFSTICLGIVLLARPALLAVTSFDFAVPLVAYVFCFANLNWLEYYWIAKRRTDFILYYSLGRLILRIGVLLTVAYVTRNVHAIIWSMVGVELVRLLAVAYFLARAGLLSSVPAVSSMKEQLAFSMPIGAATLAQYASRHIGKVYIGAAMGSPALAFYAIGSYLVPLVRVIRGSIADVVFPELVRASRDPTAALRLWQRTNVIFCVLLFPAFVVLTYHAELVVRTLFTEAYLPAVPIFQVYLLWLLRRCFNFDVLLRTSGITGFMLVGTAFSLTTNFILMMSLYALLGFVGPAIAFILSELLVELYYARRVLLQFRLQPSALVDWTSVSRVLAGCVAGSPLLLLAEYLPGPELVLALGSSIAFVSVCWWVSYRLGVDEVARIASFASSTIRNNLRRSVRSTA